MALVDPFSQLPTMPRSVSPTSPDASEGDTFDFWIVPDIVVVEKGALNLPFRPLLTKGLGFCAGL